MYTICMYIAASYLVGSKKYRVFDCVIPPSYTLSLVVAIGCMKSQPRGSFAAVSLLRGT